jgi:hypothetical protein
VLICSERKILLAGGWFVLREKYCRLVADNPNEQDEYKKSGGVFIFFLSFTTRTKLANIG